MSKLTITPYGGLGEIGMNCMLLESENSAFLIDCGLMFSDLEHFGVQFVIPNFTHMLTKKDKIKAIFVTHGHEDHIGALSFALKAGIRAPIYASHFTSLMVRERLKETGHENTVPIHIMTPGSEVDVGDFKVTPASVNHSIVDACALLIETPIGKVIHTGDFKLDASPHFGDVLEWNTFKKAGDEGVLLLMSDSTNVEREDHGHQDLEIVEHMEKLFRRAEGLIIVSMFSSNVGRMANILGLAKKLGKKVALTGRSMEQNVRLAMEMGIGAFDPNLMIPIDEINQFDRNRVMVMSTGCQGEPRSALNRIAHAEHAQVKIGTGDMVVFSSSQIPGNEVSISRLINELFKSGAEVIYDTIDAVHTSGHATKPELKKMIEMVKPKLFMPVHGEYRHLVRHAELATECGVKENHVAVIQNGEIVEVTPDGMQIVGEVGELRVLVDGREGTEITKDLLRDRRRLAETGVVFCLMVREKESGRIVGRPEVMAKGLINQAMESWLILEAGKVVDEVVRKYHQALKQGIVDPNFEEEIRVQLRRFFERNIRKKPTVVPFVLPV